MYVITAKNVSKRFITKDRKCVIFKDLSLQVNEGEIVFISGKFGSGRTTLLKMIAAMTPPNQGTIEVFGKNLLSIERRSDWRLKNIGFLTSDDCLIPYLTVKQHLLMGQDEEDPDFDLFNDEAHYILSMLEINDEQLSQYPETLTKVDRLKITLARLLMANPRILLLDEITTGLSDEEQFEVLSLLTNYVKRVGITLIITGENDIGDYYDRMLELNNGKLEEITGQQGQILH